MSLRPSASPLLPRRTLISATAARCAAPEIAADPFAELSETVSGKVDASSQSTSQPSSATLSRQYRPRWSYTPEKMLGPGFSINPVKDIRRKEWTVNANPEILDAFYRNFLGPNGDKLLQEETKWQAVTHKSFDQGRRGFNTKLGYYGRQILALESTRSILVDQHIPTQVPEVQEDGRMPFKHIALQTVDKLSHRQPQDVMNLHKMARLGREIGLLQVLRWKPRLPENLEGSGVNVVLNTTLYAIIGAISLEQGAAVANRVARDKVIKRLR